MKEEVIRVETHQIKEGTSFYNWAMKECSLNTSLYNRTLYILRQAFTGKHEKIQEYADLIKKERFISKFDLISRMLRLNDPDFRALLKVQEAQLTVKKCAEAFSTWFKTLNSYKKDPKKFTGKPRMPRYKKEANGDKLFSVVFNYDDARIQKDGTINLRRDFKLPIKTKLTSLQELRLVPKQGCVEIQIFYKKQFSQADLDYDKAVGIDIGIDNLMAVTSNEGSISHLVNGRPLKSINQYYNKKHAELKSKLAERNIDSSKKLRRLTLKRNNMVKDYMHKASRSIVNLMIQNKIGNCYIGHNTGWKQEVNIGKRNNQNFVSIPHNQLIWMLTYKSEEVGINVETHNESHTSKCSFIDNEDVCHHDEYLGRRKKRGLFVSSDGRMLNADINGAANILRRGLGKTFSPHKSMFNPKKIDIEKKHPMSVSDQGVEGEGFTHCLGDNTNTLSLTL